MPENINITEQAEKVETPFKKTEVSKTQEKKTTSALFYVVSIITALLLVVLIIGGALFLAVKFNVNGIADSMGDSIRGIPVLKWSLPEKPDPEEEKNMTEEQVRSKYNEIKLQKEELEKRVEDLTKQLDNTKNQITAKDSNSSLLQQQKDALEAEKNKLQSQKDSLQKDFDKLAEVISAGDTTEYKNYFKKINPQKADELYESIMKEEKVSADVKKYCSIYEQMDSSAVAGIMEQMGTSKMTLIIDIMKNLKKDTAGAILTEMTPAFAAKVSEQLAKEYKVGVPGTTSKK